jgi:hypothetical protein
MDSASALSYASSEGYAPIDDQTPWILYKEFSHHMAEACSEIWVRCLPSGNLSIELLLPSAAPTNRLATPETFQEQLEAAEAEMRATQAALSQK